MEHVRRFFNNLEHKLQLQLEILKIKTRPHCGNGLWVGFLLPICLIICAFKYQTSSLFQLACICAAGLTLETILFIIFTGITSRNFTKWNDTLLSALFITLLCLTKMDYGILHSFVIGAVSSIGFKNCLTTILKYCPYSFSIGEALLISQAITLFMISSSIDIYLSFYKTPVLDHEIITNILEVGIFSVFLVVITLHFLHSNMDIKMFTIVVSIYITLMITVLHITLNRSPILWMIMYIITDLKRILMIIYWAAASGLGGIAISTQTSLGSKASTARRKIFHLLAVAVYLPGFIFECDLIYLASGIALAAQIALETIRKLNLGWFSDILNDGFYVFADEKDVGGISLTPVYLLLGLAMPLFIHPSPCDAFNSLVILCSGVLSVGIGDTAASYFGSRYGKVKWPNSPKSVEGTLASVAFQILALFFLYELGFIKLEMFSTFICLNAIVVNSVIEAFTDQVDNLTLPLITFCCLVIGL